MAAGGGRPRRYEDNAVEMAFAEELRLARNRLQLSQNEVGRRMSVTGVCVSYWERGVTRPDSFAQWKRWARAVGALPLSHGGITIS